MTYYTRHPIVTPVIQSFGDSKSRRLFEGGRLRGFRGLDYERALMLLDALDAASSLAPLRALRAVRLHALTGDRRGQWAMTVNRRWRVTFRFEAGNAHEVTIEDYHKG
ncbi:MAG: type II toxin-antitoxin system RelE/ParE family toxin [Desulfurellaceae bacterium]|nr:type II toxin-antitoxin system RelE/ParE family toxin [Desulfurellaceae bacterium]